MTGIIIVGWLLIGIVGTFMTWLTTLIPSNKGGIDWRRSWWKVIPFCVCMGAITVAAVICFLFLDFVCWVFDL